MAGTIIRLKQVEELTQLSRSAIYDRMNKKSRRYDASFPKQFRLGGSAVGWFKEEVEAWGERCAAHGSRATGSGNAQPSLHTTPANSPDRTEQAAAVPVASAKRQSPTSPLTEVIFDGQSVINALQEYLQMREWTPAMAAQIVCGIKPKIGSQQIGEGGIFDFANRPMKNSHDYVGQARAILKEWTIEQEGNVPATVDTVEFLAWCYEFGVKTEWFYFINELMGWTSDGQSEIAKARIAIFLSATKMASSGAS